MPKLGFTDLSSAVSSRRRLIPTRTIIISGQGKTVGRKNLPG